ncbi:histidine kinase,Response regulator receiver domain protein,histidine kinase [Synechococcus sp. PCC 7502]|uniref:hybrid sensor histidine kinase/response regulator n=1 Tax=Synechococcus sp. PCC 7502 TaxID=1173263 RepID=UPI00029FDB1E|nr:hybrid sensor histidine kinase/response regulator [Synechococcus sp. PCC 7502]AFY73491.1 histidine kinase,Response regulator receiver domain protein,histidine kinase [Synechococcus sp. PCC 7502]
MTKPNILIVDDTPLNLTLLVEILNKGGYHVRPVPSGKLALIAVKKAAPDLILLDIMMPEMNGYEVCQALKQDDLTKYIPVIFISAIDELSDKIKAFEAGGVDYIVKPLQPQEVLARVKTHLELRSLQIQMQQSNENLKKLNEEKNYFLGIAAHDLRNPLAAITSMAQLLLSETNLQDEQKELVTDIKSATDFMLSLLKDLLDISAIESGKLNLHLQPIDVQKYVERIVSRYRMIARSKNIQIELIVTNQVPIISVDPNKFEQILSNLISNAIKFSHDHTVVKVSISAQENQVLFVVADQGQGIPETEREQLFKPFSLTSVKSTAGETSTGLGLAITHRLVSAHNGKISVESEVGKGSVFSVALPF